MDDLISRQDAIEILGAQCNRDYGKVCGKDCECIEYMELRDMQSAQQWIPCSERMPEKFGDYLVSVKRHGWNCEEHIENDIAYWDDLEGFHKAEEVLAWMPLPEPYREEATE